MEAHQNAHTGPRKYMSKGRRACDLCRSRKSACQIEVAPPCRMCRAHGQQCEFTNRVVRKKRPAPRPVAEKNDNNTPGWHSEVQPAHSDTEQLSWPQGLDFLSIPENNLTSVSPSNMEGHVFGGPGLSHMSNEQLTPGFLSDPENADQFMIDDLMLSIYEGRTLPPDVYQGAGNGLHSLDHSPLTSQVCGLTGDQDPYVLRHYQFDEKSEFVFSKLAIRRVEDGPVPVQFLLSKPELSADSRSQTDLRNGPETKETPSLSEIVPPEVAERLIDLFFRFVNPQFPVLSGANRPCPRTSPTHLLAAIYSITQPFTVFDDKLSIELAYNHPSPQTLSNISWRSLNDEISEPTIQSLQAALIMLLKPPSNPLLLEHPLKWTLLGLTVSMAQTLGLHLDPTGWNLPLEEIECRKRLAWLVWASDKWCAFSLGRPSHISKNNWMIIELDTTEQDHSLPDAADQSSRFYTTQFSKLTLILDSVLTDL
ncbi:putative transcriptional regulatory protein C105,03c [Talaromyces islandicus]|uniref:Putative transcriptional regulatory protein C105,03c n=1 Tax=Talaromyces islandicus TaxID=28573 RepID=A0A0U1LYA8_TALIS|nr:putative transcriptional regulatory protein C105,03c [Talaromyces islandicus]